MKIRIINACCDLGVNIDGSSIGPKILKEYLIDNEKIDKIIDCECDCTNKSNDPKDLEKNFNRLNKFNEELYNTLLENKDDDVITITVGGDHSVAIPSALSSIKKEKSLGIIWIDTHPDFNTFDTTVTGNIHGLPLATITGNNTNRLSEFHDGNFYKNENTIIIGARDIDLKEQENLTKANIKIYTTDDIKRNNIKEIVEDSVNIALKNTNGIHVSCDIDVLDPLIAPGISVGYKDGITLEELECILDNLFLYKDKIKSFDLVEFNPLNDTNKKTEKIAISLLNKIIDNLETKETSN